LAFYDTFEQLCREKGVTPTQAGRDNGISQGVVSMWKKRGSIPNAVTLMKLCEYFDTNPAYLMGNDMAKGSGFGGGFNERWANGITTTEDLERLRESIDTKEDSLYSKFRIKDVVRTESGGMKAILEFDEASMTLDELRDLLDVLSQATFAGISTKSLTQTVEQLTRIIQERDSLPPK